VRLPHDHPHHKIGNANDAEADCVVPLRDRPNFTVQQPACNCSIQEPEPVERQGSDCDPEPGVAPPADRSHTLESCSEAKNPDEHGSNADPHHEHSVVVLKIGIAAQMDPALCHARQSQQGSSTDYAVVRPENQEQTAKSPPDSSHSYSPAGEAGCPARSAWK
jgi:hypothetical protein